MGIGLHGGGLETIRYLERHGARVTATDLRSESELRPTLNLLESSTVRLVIGRHEAADFEGADLVVKNPAVPRSAPNLLRAPAITTDVALYLSVRSREAHRGKLIAVTGTKGKSTTAGACAHMVAAGGGEVRLGGNITVSPLAFADELDGSETIVLELSSFQLGDLAFAAGHNGQTGRNPLPPVEGSLAPDVAVITNIMHDHQDYYHSMELYAADKERVFLSQGGGQLALLPDDRWGSRFSERAPGRVGFVGTGALSSGRVGAIVRADGSAAWIDADSVTEIDLSEARLPGRHNAINLVTASLSAREVGVAKGAIEASIPSFPGVPHRMEEVGSVRGVRFVNDSAATIPEATLASAEAFAFPVVLIAGGTDKEIDVTPMQQIASAVRGVHLIAGSATDRMVRALQGAPCPVEGPFPSLEETVASAYAQAVRVAADASGAGGAVVLFSPGAASFEMFRNEFDRGDAFRTAAGRYLSEEPRTS